MIYTTSGLDLDSTYLKTKILLKIYRKACWGMNEKFDDLNAITYASCMSADEEVCYLLNFAPEKELEAFRDRAVSAMQTRALIDLIDKAVVKMKDYPDCGETYYSIIERKYLTFFSNSESEILEELDMERSTYYRKTKEATMLLGYVLFDIVFPERLRACD